MAPGTRHLRLALGLNGLRMSQVLGSLIKHGLITRAEHPNGLRTEVEYSLTENFKSWMQSDATSANHPNAPTND